MRRKLHTPLLVLVALAAFALPAVASAATNPEITHPTGTRLATGTKIKMTSVGVEKWTAPGGATLVECSSSTMTGTLVRNNGTETEITIESTSFSGTAAGGACTSTFGNITVDTNIGNGTPWCVRSTSTMNADEFQIRGNACNLASRSITYVLTSTTAGTCKYNRATPDVGTYKTDTSPDNSDAILSIGSSVGSESTKSEGGFLCPSAMVRDWSYTLETDTATPEPLYFS